MNERSHDRNHPTSESRSCSPPVCLSVDELEDELLAAILADDGAESPVLTIIDEYFTGDDVFEHEEQHRRVLLWLLSFLRPHLADLLGGPRAD